MKKIFLNTSILFGFVISVLLISCEQTVQNPELPYREQLVITGVLEAGKKVEGIEITRTLPPLDQYNFDSALVKNAEAVIKSDGVSYPLNYNALSQRYNTENLIPETGKKYSLEVKYKNLIATASTIIPEPVELDTFYYKVEYIKIKDIYYEDEYWLYTIYTEYKPKSGAVYLASSQYDNNDYKNYTEDIKRYQDTLKNGKIKQSIFQYTTYDTTNFKYDIQFYSCSLDSYDTQFYHYFLTRWQGGSDFDIFGTSGVNVRGNIKNGIGIFIGTSSTSSKIVLK
ncbi:MAG: DUF4249 family protein [bacterium]